jgi:hypothetical protein
MRAILTNASLSYNGLMVQQLWLLIIFLFSWQALAQDERYFRQILKGEVPRVTKEIVETTEFQFNVKGNSYAIDLNGDGIEEFIQPQKRDGVDWLEIKNSSGSALFEAKLMAMGGDSKIDKIRFAHLSSKTKVLIIFLDEGQTSGRRFESTSRIFLVTLDDNDFSSFKLTQGPHFFHEKERQRDQYWRRKYSVEVRDINDDGIRDVVVEYDHIQRIMLYKKRGEWERL